MKQYKYKINGNLYNVTVNDPEENIVNVEVNGTPYKVELDKPVKPAVAPKPVTRPAAAPKTDSGAPVVQRPASTGSGKKDGVKSPLPGVILEAMKMENNINAHKDGKVVEIKVKQGDSVLEGTDLVIIE